MLMNSEMRGCVIRHHKGKLEIEAMDVELPITIFILTRVRCKDLVAHLEFVKSYLKSKEESDHQERLIANILVAVALPDLHSVHRQGVAS